MNSVSRLPATPLEIGDVTAARAPQSVAANPLWLLALSAALLLATVLVPTRAQAEADQGRDHAISLINKMANALEMLTYRGTFVHIYGGQVESMRILHARDDTGVNERMISLNGEAREVFRNNKLVTCIWPGSQSIIVTKSKPRELLPKVDKSLTTSDYYLFSMLADDRVAGLDTYVVGVQPKDEFRYGYRFWIEKETSMLLRSALMDSDKRNLEELMFTDISFPDSIPLAELTADTRSRADTSSWLESGVGPESTPDEERVTFETLPGGYRKVSETYRPMPMNDGPVSHVLISDGMASISVYVEYTKKPGKESGIMSMGAMSAYGRSMENAMITVVGEVPTATVKSIGDAVKVSYSE